MQISIETSDDVKILAFQGKLDTQTASDAEQQLTEQIEGGTKKILANFEKLDYVSSAGLRVLLATAKKLKATEGEMRICSLNEMVKEVFDISGFMTIFKVFESKAEALEKF